MTVKGSDMDCALDHLVVRTGDLIQGRSAMESLLGIAMSARGMHAQMGTHNHLAALDRDSYLEVIAVDPAAIAPKAPRWFDMDNFSGSTKLSNWVIRCDDLDYARSLAPPGIGEERAFVRGDYAWRMLVPHNGQLPFDGCYPAIMSWDSKHPAPALAPQGLSLRGLRITHPQADDLRDALKPFADAMENVRIVQGARAALAAEITTPSGEIWIT
ncbi:VOC family protein [Celeribacter arenosi]|uniref:VOC family protein n=1 Tax=Celeribacter arenosi TaxID=792649 RepID=A0ABP7JT69_9RHOB